MGVSSVSWAEPFSASVDNPTQVSNLRLETRGPTNRRVFEDLFHIALAGLDVTPDVAFRVMTKAHFLSQQVRITAVSATRPVASPQTSALATWCTLAHYLPKRASGPHMGSGGLAIR